MMTEKEAWNATNEPLSEYAKFHLACSGYDFIINGKKISRSVLFHNGFIDAENLIANKTIYKAVARPKYEPIIFK